MTNVMHNFLIYLSIYFCITCFGLSFSPSSEAGLQLRQWFKSPAYGVSARALTPYPQHPIIKLKLTLTVTERTESYPENGGGSILRNIGEFLPDHVASHLR
jgi:hypothetical protein